MFDCDEFKTGKKYFLLSLPELVTFCHVDVGQDRRNALRFVNESGLWGPCSDVLFCFFLSFI